MSSQITVKLRPIQIAQNISSADQLGEISQYELLLMIKKLQAAILHADEAFTVQMTNQYGQVFIDQFDVWFDKDEWVETTIHNDLCYYLP